MLPRFNRQFAVIACALIISSCTRNQSCIDPELVLNFVSFTNAETDSIVLRKYVKNVGFTSLVDSTIISRSNSLYQQSNDTLHIFTSVGGDYPVDIQFDYEVYMPAGNKLFEFI